MSEQTTDSIDRLTRVTTYHRRAGSTASPPYEIDITPDEAGWTYSGLHVLVLPAGGEHQLATGDAEMVLLPLNGGCSVSCDRTTFELAGRVDVFAGPSDFAYLPRDASVTIRSAEGGRFALTSAVCERRLEFRYGAASDVGVERRGAGSCARTVHNFCSADGFEADRLIAVEVLTPAGNWSSYPPHKHDEASEHESVLEEIYYYEVARGGMGYQRVYGTAERPIDVLAEVRTGDVVLIPHGWHGPSMAVPGYDLYYLNVMAGPDPERAWKIVDDPAHTWIRTTW